MTASDFYKHDGAYSWIVLVVLILNTFSTYGFIAGNMGMLGDAFPELFNEDPVKTNIVSSVAFGVFLFSSMYNYWLPYTGCKLKRSKICRTFTFPLELSTH